MFNKKKKKNMNKKKSITRTYSVLTYIKFMMYYELLHIQFSIRTVATGAQNVLSNKIKIRKKKYKSWTKIIKEKKRWTTLYW